MCEYRPGAAEKPAINDHMKDTSDVDVNVYDNKNKQDCAWSFQSKWIISLFLCWEAAKRP